MVSTLNYDIVERPAYRAMGLKWEGSFNDAHELGKIIATAKERVKELEHAINPDEQLGLSYHLRPDGFTHYSVYEVSPEQKLPEDMIEIDIPKLTYLKTHHEKGENVAETYEKILQWVKKSEYDIYKEPHTSYYDSLPIKHERYPNVRDPQDPHFDIYIPIVK